MVVQHPQEHLAHATCTVHIPVPRRLALGAPAYTVDFLLLEGVRPLPRYLSSSREQLERMWCARFCCREGALSVVLMEDNDMRVELQPFSKWWVMYVGSLRVEKKASSFSTYTRRQTLL